MQARIRSATDVQRFVTSFPPIAVLEADDDRADVTVMRLLRGDGRPPYHLFDGQAVARALNVNPLAVRRFLSCTADQLYDLLNGSLDDRWISVGDFRLRFPSVTRTRSSSFYIDSIGLLHLITSTKLFVVHDSYRAHLCQHLIKNSLI